MPAIRAAVSGGRPARLLCAAAGLLYCLSWLAPAAAQCRALPLYEPEAAAAPCGAWGDVPPGLHGAVGSIDQRYPPNEPPAVVDSTAWSGTALRGERLCAQIVFWSNEPAEQLRLEASPLRDAEGRALGADGIGADGIGADGIKAWFVRYTRGGDYGELYGDILDPAPMLDLAPCTTRPIWVAVDVPRDAPAGLYRGSLTVRAAGGRAVDFDLAVTVLPLTLPPPREWSFHLDLWQNPYAVARFHRVEPWSPAHLALLEPHLRLLVSAGQKILTATIVHQPWGTQTYDPYESMVEWIRAEDGGWRFDYSVLDRWIDFGAGCGLDGPIHCFSTVPWTNKVRFRDAATGDMGEIAFTPGDAVYAELFSAFLLDFAAHARAKGWADRVAIAMDERPPDQMTPAVSLIRELAPEFRIALAGHNNPELKDAVDDWCVFLQPPLDGAIVRERAERARTGHAHLRTTFYVCCSPPCPNTFTHSPPAEAAWLGLYAAAAGLDGFLRWAYDSWVEDPFTDTKHVTWPAGDCFLVYPGARSSVRFERLREGIQAFEKIRMLRKAAAGGASDPEVRRALEGLDAALKLFTFEEVNRSGAARAVNAAKQAIEELARAVSG